jgi:serine protease Do
VDSLREYRDGQTVTLGLRRDETNLDTQVRMTTLKSGQLASDLSSRSRSSRVMGEVSQRAEGFEKAIEHDSVLQPWLCGGPLVNVDGKAVGINIARAGRVTTYALPGSLVKRIYEHLKPAPTLTPTARREAPR